MKLIPAPKIITIKIKNKMSINFVGIIVKVLLEEYKPL